jgi:hypothetical protein
LTLSDSFMREITPDAPIWQATRANFDFGMSLSQHVQWRLRRCELSSLAGVDGTVISVGGLAAVHFGWSQASLDGERLLGVLSEAAAIAIFAIPTWSWQSGGCPVSGSTPPARRSGRALWPRQSRGRLADCPTGRWQTARAGHALPVSPVSSGRDQASATPSIAISHPLTGAMPGKV